MRPNAVSAWACGFCGKTYPKNKYGKNFAETCCSCETAGCDRMASRTGLGQRCKLCCARLSLKSVEEHAASLTHDVQLRRKELAELEARDAERAAKAGGRK